MSAKRKIHWYLSHLSSGSYALYAGPTFDDGIEMLILNPKEREDNILLRLFKPPKLRLGKGKWVEICFDVEPIAWEVRG